MFHSGGGLLSILFGILTSVVSVVAAAIVFLAVLGVLFLLVRFLWFGTRAAQVYLVKNGEPGHFTWPIRPVAEPGLPMGAPPAYEGTSDAAREPEREPEPYSAASDSTSPTTPLPDNAAAVPPRAPRKPKSPPTA
ncbi:hypothetical protein N1027_00130 [Herbiconiux sp. CPCC 205763]|uniref:Uncharacterized protein n=1 Tax=Herbiconiux aconitum TaxID=2970913 RepID=A0ABT2GJY9_9MICO|nr:hypothetical protein [Herbiconiux aconitum]MCS5716540.1 hypothetical protein [Herbiconiux aconitum]